MPLKTSAVSCDAPSSLGRYLMLGGFLRDVTGTGEDYHALQIPTVRGEAVKVPTR